MPHTHDSQVTDDSDSPVSYRTDNIATKRTPSRPRPDHDGDGLPSKNSDSSDMSSHERMINILSGYRRSADHDIVAHELAARRFARRDRFLTLPMKILPFLATCFLVPDVGAGSENCGTGNGLLVQLAMVCTFISGTLAIVKSIYGLDERAEEHRSVFLSLGELSREIAYFQARRHTDQELDGFVEITEHKLSMYNKQAPDIPRDIAATVDTLVASEGTDACHIRAIRSQASHMGNRKHRKHRKRHKQAVRQMASLDETQLRNILRTQVSSVSEQGTDGSHVSATVGPNMVSVFSRRRTADVNSKLHEATKQELLTSTDLATLLNLTQRGRFVVPLKDVAESVVSTPARMQHNRSIADVRVNIADDEHKERDDPPTPFSLPPRRSLPLEVGPQGSPPALQHLQSPRVVHT